jgi:flavin reductase (DIM6/NTAB) family NADH-FMN oxidoreductase RutF
MAIEKEFFRQVMGRFATGVTVVTTRSQGEIAGITVNAFCSVSLNPPLVLVCIDTKSNMLPLFRESKVFAVNMLTNKQEDISRGFASNSKERYENFYNASYHIAITGAPIIDGVLAFVDTRIVAEYPGGDHIIFLGQVEAMGTEGKVVFVNDEGQEQSTLINYDGTQRTENVHPLMYYQGQYHHITEQYQQPSAAETITAKSREEQLAEQTRGR